MIIKQETRLKIEILTRGVRFTKEALEKAKKENAKIQNMVYNIPSGLDRERPQELFLQGDDGYITVVSCVAPNNIIAPVIIDLKDKEELFAVIQGKFVENVKISFVKEPSYYSKKLKNGDSVKKYVSACGYDELNILPWKGCALSQLCKFCGVNTVACQSETDIFNAHSISGDISLWSKNKDSYLVNLVESIKIAMTDECYNEHMHLIMISGNLKNELLNEQAEIYAQIADEIKEVVLEHTSEGIIAVISPPEDEKYLYRLKEAGIEKIVFNLEVGNEPWFSKYCPGKSELGYDYFWKNLLKSVKIFGVGNVWTNFVFGLEPWDKLLEVCEKLAINGIVAGANILHLDEGNRLDCGVPSFEDSINFFSGLGRIYKKYNFKPYYCSKALRTSLSNEAYENRIIIDKD